MATKYYLLIALLVVLSLIAACSYLYGERLGLSYLASRTLKTTVAERAALLAPALLVYPPAMGNGLFPVVIQFHSCAGMRLEFQEQYVRAANAAGYMAVVVDSHTPRGITHARAMETVCKGRELLGQERAGDVLAAIDVVRRRVDVDASRIVLAGWSHGGWSIMDYIALRGAGRTPTGIVGPAPDEPMPAAVFVVYPYCGLGSWTRLIGWRTSVPMLGLFAEQDSVNDTRLCTTLFGRLAAADPRIAYHVHAGVDHAFDDPSLPEEFRYRFNAPARDDAVARFRAFLEQLSRGGSLH